jgi:HupE / UreJ protein
MSHSRARTLTLTSAIVFLLASFAHAADRPLPETVDVKAFARLTHGQMELLVRVPLAAVKDVQFPVRGDAGYLDLAAVRSMLPGAARYWIASRFLLRDHGVALTNPDVTATRISITADRSFDSYDEALARFRAPELPADDNVFWDQVWFDIQFVYHVRSDRPVLTLDPKVAELGVHVSTDLTYVDADASVRAWSFEGDPGAIYLAPRRRDASAQFLARGARFALGRADLLLFVFCLAMPFRHYRRLLPAAATFAASIVLALLASALGFAPNPLWFHPLIETLAAIAILLVACANIAGSITPRRRALLALAAGAVFGLICAARLETTISFGGAHPAAARLAFGAGTVAAVAGTLGLLVPALTLLFSRARAERIERIVVSALAADTAWNWLGDRWARLSRIPVPIAFDAGMLPAALRSLAALVLLGGLVWFVNEWLKSYSFADEPLAPPIDRERAA